MCGKQTDGGRFHRRRALRHLTTPRPRRRRARRARQQDPRSPCAAPGPQPSPPCRSIAYRQGGHCPDGYERRRPGPNGYGPDGLGPDGQGPDGLGPDGQGPDGQGPDGYDPDGQGPPDGQGQRDQERDRARRRDWLRSTSRISYWGKIVPPSAQPRREIRICNIIPFPSNKETPRPGAQWRSARPFIGAGPLSMPGLGGSILTGCPARPARTHARRSAMRQAALARDAMGT